MECPGPDTTVKERDTVREEAAKIDTLPAQ